MTDVTYRNHGVYLREDHHAKPKERDKVLADLIASHKGSLPADAKVIDVGCATGALVGYLSSVFPAYRYTGTDIFPELLEEGRAKVPGAEFHIQSATELPGPFAGQFDVTICTGVLGIFGEEDARKVVDGLLAATRKGGFVYLFANFNDADADVLVTHRKWRDGQLGAWENGWNIISQRTLAHWLEGKVKSFRFLPFAMPFPIDRVDDPSRTYTIRDEHGNLLLVNGLRILAQLQYLEIEV